MGPRQGTTRAALGASILCGLGVLVLVGRGTTAGGSLPTPGVVTTAHVSFNLQAALPGHYVTPVRGSGQIDFTHRAVAMSLTLPPSGLHANALAKGKKTPSATALQFRAEWINGVAYLLVSPSLATLTGGAPTVSYPVPSSLAGAISNSIGQTAVAVTYAHLLLDTLVGSDPRRVGSKRIDGARVTGTAVNLTLSELLKVVPAMAPAMGSALAPMAKSAIPATIWTDSRGRLVEATLTKPRSAAAGLTGTVQFSDFGAPVSISAPPAATVRPIGKGELAFFEAVDPFPLAG
jgi:hypothetical protein